MPNLKGTLYVVATPIGNLQDLSPRAQAVLREVTLIVAEDTRHSRHLLTHFGITTSLQSLHEHNEHKMAPLLSLINARLSPACNRCNRSGATLCSLCSCNDCNEAVIPK